MSEFDYVRLARGMNEMFLAVEGTRAERIVGRHLATIYDIVEYLDEHPGFVPSMEPLEPRRCSNCDREFTPTDADRRWCPSCARAGKAMVAMHDRDEFV